MICVLTLSMHFYPNGCLLMCREIAEGKNDEAVVDAIGSLVQVITHAN